MLLKSKFETETYMDQNNLPSVSIIVLNYNGLQYLKDCFSSLLALDYPNDKFEIVMVDNGSTDGSVHFTETNFPAVRIVRLDKNYGFAKGNNIGADHAKFEYLAFLNNDTVVDRKWLIALVEGAMADGGLIVNSKVLYLHNKNIFNIGRGYINFWGAGICKGAGEDHMIYNEPVYVIHPTGCSMLLKKDDFNGIGKFDEDFFAYHEDVDFGWRAWIYGYRIKYIPSSIVYHKSGGTAGAFSPFKAYMITRNTLFYILKNCQAARLFPTLFLNMLFDVLVSLYFLLPFKSIRLPYAESAKVSLAILKGMLFFLTGMPRYIRKRRAIQAGRIIDDKRLVRMGVIMTFGESFRNLANASARSVNRLIKSAGSA